ncbi:MAG: hypothetical protein KDC87_11230 [Planctomycetes bacterium]|nr:hypothetical protein [Planctomycetota bacterium]
MTKSLLSVLVFAFVTLGSLAAQTSQVKNTGCPGALYPTATNVKINQTATFGFPTMSAADVPIMILGYQTGNPISLGTPLTCVNGCVLYTQTLFISILPLLTTTVNVPIPNDPSLFMTCFGIQTAAGKPSGCLDLHGSLTFCVGR